MLLVISTALAIAVTQSQAKPALKVVVDGKQSEISEEELEKLPSHDVTLTEHDGTVLNCSGPLISDILGKAGIALGDHVRGKALAAYVLAKASDGYEVVFGLGELEPTISGRNIVLAYKANGQALIASAGPLRVVVGGDKKQARSVRMVTELDVVHIRD